MEKQSSSNFILTAVGVVGSMLIFLIVLGISYIPRDVEPANQQIVDQRLATRETIEAAGSQALREAKLIDAENGIYKVPVDQAVALTIQKLQED